VKRYTSREVRQALVGKGNLRNRLSDRIADWNPYQSGSRQHLKKIYQQEALQGWQQVRHLFEELCSIDALENSWACIAHLHDLCDFLYTGVVLENDPPTVQRATQLLFMSKRDRADKVSFLSLLDRGAEVDTLDLLGQIGFSGMIRIRWGLACRVQREVSHLELLQCAGAVESVPVKQASRLLQEALSHCDNYKPKQLASPEATTLSAAEFATLVSDSVLFKTMYAQGSVSFEVAVKKIESLRSKYASDLALLKSIFLHLEQRNWSQAGKIAAGIVTDATANLAARFVAHDMGDIADITNRQSTHGWSAMPELGHSHLVKLFGKSKVPGLWRLDAEQLAHKLVSGELPVRSLSPLDIFQLGETWSLKTKKALIAAQRFQAIESTDQAWRDQSTAVLALAASKRPSDAEDFLLEHLPDIKDADEILSALVSIGSKKFSAVLKDVVSQRLWRNAYRTKAISWDEFVSDQIGTSSWSIAVEKGLIKKATVSQLSYAAIKSGVNSKTDAFVAETLATLRRTKRVIHSDAVDIMRWIDARPADSSFIAPSLSASLIQKICVLRPSDCSIQSIKRLYEASTPEQRAKLWLTLLNHAADADHLIELGLEGAAKGWQCPWVSRWKSVNGNVQQRARALVLMTRNDLHQLRQLRRIFTEEVIAAALLWTSSQLPSPRSFEKIFLELSSCLGLRHGSTLRWLLSNRAREKLPGAKFDHLYTRHEIPKKSGKMRLISAPNASLKRIQRSISVTLLDPLLAHDAAYGFVIGKSIVGNASLHVGKSLVVNADVQNCFPSVRWPLVRAALMRDLSDRLSPLSISFLVDLCTADGVLPIGAPTSPAILNRVLYKTDQILSQQAALRECSYSRYADDLTFSGGEKAVGLLGIARGVLGQIGLELDPQKTNIFRRGRRQMCTGLVVNDRVNVPRTIKKKLRAAVHAFEEGRPLVWGGESMGITSLRGRLEFLKMVAPETAAPLIHRFEAVQKIKPTKKKRKSVSPSKIGSS